MIMLGTNMRDCLLGGWFGGLLCRLCRISAGRSIVGRFETNVDLVIEIVYQQACFTILHTYRLCVCTPVLLFLEELMFKAAASEGSAEESWIRTMEATCWRHTRQCCSIRLTTLAAGCHQALASDLL